MPRALDLIGKKYGKLTVLSRYGSDRHGNATFLCQCDCGAEAIIVGKELKGQVSPRCRSCNRVKSEDLRGRRFGMLVVTDVSGRGRGKNSLVSVTCDCGKQASVSRGALAAGQKSCGCWIRSNRHKIIDLTGCQIGQITPLRYAGDQCWECVCACGWSGIVRGASLRRNANSVCEDCRKVYTVGGVKFQARELLEALGISRGTLKRRKRLGLSLVTGHKLKPELPP